MPGRTIAIGDIHGCSTALTALLDAIAPTAEDTLVTLGDYIDRGPDSRGVIEQLIALERRCRLVPLLGNHEEMLLGTLVDPSMTRIWLSCGGVEAMASYGVTLARGQTCSPEKMIPPEHWAFLTRCLNYHETESRIFLHAGYEPNVPMNQQSVETLHWKFTDALWAKPHRSGKTVVCGHTPQRSGEILDLGFLVCIDTHCHAGKWLTALEVYSGELCQTNQQGETRRSKRHVEYTDRGRADSAPAAS